MSKMTFEVALKEPLSGLILFEELHSSQWFVERADPRKFFRYKLGQQYELRFGLASLRLIKPEKGVTMARHRLTKEQQIAGIRGALKSKRTPKQFLPSLRKRLAKLTK